MKLLRLAMLSALFGCAVLAACAQTAQPVLDQSSAAAQAGPGATQPFTILPGKPPHFQFPAPKPSQDFRVLGPLRLKMKTPPQGDFDRGIYAMRLAAPGQETCGSILSYNFSAGESPQLESVTTCTSSSMVQALRARGKDKKPPVGPLYKTTDLKTGSPQ